MTVDNRLKRTKILFILPSLHPGGAERVVSFLAQNISKAKFEARLLILYEPSERDYKIKDIHYEYLNKKRTLMAIPAIIKRINTFKPDIVFSSITQLNILGGILNNLYRKTVFVGREASVATVNSSYANKKDIWSFIKPLAYKFLSHLVCQSYDMKRDMEKTLKIPGNNITVIGNPASFPSFRRNGLISAKEPYHLITVGRLVKVKGTERILQVLSEVNFKFTYTLIGNGSEKEKILKLASDLGIRENINHIPYTNKVHEYLTQADLFLQGSYTEGFPNALLESCTVGVPVLAFEAPGGTKEIVEEGVNGFVAKDKASYKIKLNKALEKTWDTEAVVESVNRKYNEKSILLKFEELFNNLI